VMIGVVASNALITRYYSRSIFHRQILRLGIDLDRPREQRLMAARRVAEIMTPDYLRVQPDNTAAELQTLVSRRQEGDLFVVEQETHRLVGRLPLATLVAARDDQTAMELCEPVSLYLQRSDNLWTGFLAMENLEGHSLPVVDDSTSMRLAGSVLESDFIAAYREAVEQEREEQEVYKTNTSGS